MEFTKIERVSVIGCHTTSLGIAASCLLAGIFTTIIRTTPGNMIEARRRLEVYFQEKRRAGELKLEQMESALSRLHTAAQLSATRGSDLILEMTSFPVPSRQTLLRLCERAAGKGAILATSASPLLVRPLAARLEKRENLVGMHFLSAAVLAGLCEVSPTDRTEPTVLLTAMQFAYAIGKLPILLRGRWAEGLLFRQSPAPRDLFFQAIRAAG